MPETEQKLKVRVDVSSGNRERSCGEGDPSRRRAKRGDGELTEARSGARE